MFFLFFPLFLENLNIEESNEKSFNKKLYFENDISSIISEIITNEPEPTIDYDKLQSQDRLGMIVVGATAVISFILIIAFIIYWKNQRKQSLVVDGQENNSDADDNNNKNNNNGKLDNPDAIENNLLQGGNEEL